jgi:outer membrane lipoprotein-sorting protein
MGTAAKNRSVYDRVRNGSFKYVDGDINTAKDLQMKTRTFFFGVVILVLMGACSAASSPKTAVQKFYKAVEKNDTKAMAEVATTETVQLVALFGTKIQDTVSANGKVKTITETIDGDTAVVTVIFENGEESNIDLIKVDGKWKVSVSMGK